MPCPRAHTLPALGMMRKLHAANKTVETKLRCVNARLHAARARGERSAMIEALEENVALQKIRVRLVDALVACAKFVVVGAATEPSGAVTEPSSL